MALKQNITFGAFSLWGIYGGVRGWNFYNEEYQLTTQTFVKKNKEHPDFYPEKDRPNYYYITRFNYAVAGVFYYMTPITFCFAGINEIYRAEVNLRSLNNCKKLQPYYNPFYPVYHSQK